MQVCSVLHVAHVGVRRVTVVIVHIGHEDVVVVIYFCVAIFGRDLLYQEMYSVQTKTMRNPRRRQAHLFTQNTHQEKEMIKTA